MCLRAACAHVGDLRGDTIDRIAVHDVRVALGGDEILGRLGLAAGVDGRAGTPYRLGLQDQIVHRVVAAAVRQTGLAPCAAHDVEPFRGARVAVVVLIEVDAVAACFVGPPCTHDIQRKAAIGDLIDVRRLLGELRGRVILRTHGDHELESLGDGGEGGGGAPCVEGGRIGALDVVEKELGDEREIEAQLFTSLRELSCVGPARVHALVVHVAEPATKHGKPVAESHAARRIGADAGVRALRSDRRAHAPTSTGVPEAARRSM